VNKREATIPADLTAAARLFRAQGLDAAAMQSPRLPGSSMPPATASS